jgi:hypothetical protein
LRNARKVDGIDFRVVRLVEDDQHNRYRHSADDSQHHQSQAALTVAGSDDRLFALESPS